MKQPTSLTGWIITETPGYNAKVYTSVGQARGHQIKVINFSELSLFIKEGQTHFLINQVPTSPPNFLIDEYSLHFHHHCLNLLEALPSSCYLIYPPKGVANIYDKFKTHQLLSANQINTPKTMKITFPCRSELIEAHIGFPCLIKNTHSAMGQEIFKCQNAHTFDELSEWLANTYNKDYIAQGFLQKNEGLDYRVVVLDGKILTTVKRTAAPGRYKSNLHQGGSFEVIKPCEQMQKLAIQAQKISGLTLAGIDIMVDDEDNLTVIEINHDPYLKLSIDSQTIANQVYEHIEAHTFK